MLAVLAEFERDQIAERTKAAMSHKKAKGERVGAIPYGFDLSEDGKNLKKNSAEQLVIRQALELKQSGLSLRAISKELAGQGFKARNGNEFDAKQIQRILTAA